MKNRECCTEVKIRDFSFHGDSLSGCFDSQGKGPHEDLPYHIKVLLMNFIYHDSRFRVWEV